VVNVSSVEAWTGTAEHIGSYAAAKAGLQALTRTAAAESGPRGVRVNAVAPGLMVNRAVQALLDAEQLQDVVGRTALRRAGTAEDVARVVYFLATDASRFVTGDVVNVSGGLYYHA
jgi:3-oxoacyl-[acyl-carrier protein] reductase